MKNIERLLEIKDLHKRAFDGVMTLNCRMSNPNGDPDCGGAPRKDPYDFGIISAESEKRKIRDLVMNKDIMEEARKVLDLPETGYEILESHASKGDTGEKRASLHKLTDAEFCARFFDVRIFGATLLNGNVEKSKDSDSKKTKAEVGNKTFRGCCGISHSVSVCRVNLVTQTITSTTGAEENKDRGMGPNALNVVRHAVYPVYFSYRPILGAKTGVSDVDIKLFLWLLDKTCDFYSVNRTGMDIVQIFVGVHNNAIGSFKRYEMNKSLTPVRILKNGEVSDSPSTTLDDYEMKSLESVKDLDGEFFSLV